MSCLKRETRNVRTLRGQKCTKLVNVTQAVHTSSTLRFLEAFFSPFQQKLGEYRNHVTTTSFHVLTNSSLINRLIIRRYTVFTS